MPTPRRKRRSSRKWDRHAIKAAVERSGHTLASLSRAKGFPAHAFKMALQKPLPRYDFALADWLGDPPCVVWPDRYDEKGNRIVPIRKSTTGFRGNQSAREAA